MVVCSVESASYSTLTYNCSSLVLIDAPITPNFPSSSNHENVGDYVQIRCWPTIFHTITIGNADGWCLN